jgi:hypothetical protein
MTYTAAKLSRGLVGAWRFELQTSCAQGRRATRLRYAPTLKRPIILEHFPTLLLVRTIVFASDCARTVHECVIGALLCTMARSKKHRPPLLVPFRWLDD